MKHLILFSLALLLFAANAMSQRVTAKQLYDEHKKNSLNFENKYRNKALVITGKIRSIVPVTTVWKDYENFHHVNITATGYENYIVCQIPHKDSAVLKSLNAGDEVTVSGTSAPKILDAIYLKGCTFATSTPLPAPKKNIPAHLSPGLYSVYQADAAGFSYQYALNILSYTSYTAYGKKGTCQYQKAGKTIRFTSGPLKNFAGLYVPSNPKNENDPPVLLINAKGNVPDPNVKFGGYQYAYRQTNQ